MKDSIEDTPNGPVRRNNKADPYWEKVITAQLHSHGTTIAAGLVPALDHAEHSEPAMRIFSAADPDTAAQSIWISGVENIETLRRLCDEVLGRDRANLQLLMEKNDK